MSNTSSKYDLREVRRGAELDETYGVLHGWFGVRAELERREVIDAWLAQPDGYRVGDIRGRYHMLTARAADGTLAAVRDCHVTVHAGRGTCVIYLAHVYVMPDHRRTGLAQLLRDVPLDVARGDLSEWGLPPEGEIMFAAEQEFYDPAALDTAVRLIAYGRNGYQAIPPHVLPYQQADFRDVSAAGGVAQPLPLLAVIRRLGHEGEPTLPVALAAAFVEHLYAVHSTHCRLEDIAAPRRHALETLAATGLSEVPLVTLPKSLEDRAALDAVSHAAALAHFAVER